MTTELKYISFAHFYGPLPFVVAGVRSELRDIL